MMLTKKKIKNRRNTKETAKACLLIQTAMPDAQVEAYRYDSVSIRIRIIADIFDGKPVVEREKLVWPTLRKLDPETRTDLSLVLMFSREEIASGDILVNFEFDEPTPGPW